jgi:hypothetical protein
VSDLQRLPRFLEMSSTLTGFTVFELQGTGQADPYLSTVSDVAGAEIVDELLDAYDRVQAAGTGESDLGTGLRREILADEKLGPIARNIIKMWFVGIWYELPSAWRETFGAREADVMHMVSAGAYTEGLLWPTIGANPNGAKAPGYASWAQPPRIPTIDSN